MKKLLTILLAGMMLVSLAACSQGSASPASDSQTAPEAAETTAEMEEDDENAGTVSITHSLGTVEVPYMPQRAAVLDMAVLDMLDAWDLGDRVVGMAKDSKVAHLLAYAESDAVAHLGNLKEVDMETLHSLEPDVIFIGGRLRAEYDNLSKIAPTVLMTIDNETGYMKGLEENVAVIASVFGMENKAAEMLSGFDGRIAALSETAAGKTAIVGMVTSGSFNTLGDAGRCSLISNEVGFENLANDVNSTHGDSSSFELLLDKNPDYIFVLDRDAAIGAEGSHIARDVMENEIVMKTDAYQNGRIVYLSPDVWYLAEGGITSTDIMLRDLEAHIQAE